LIPNVLSIAGSDPGGGAGIQADLKTFAALGCHGMAAITALTAQNTIGVSAIHVPPAAFVAEQITQVFADIDVAAVKIGMLGAPDIVAAVADALRSYPLVPIVVDPVLVATSGATLGDEAVVEAMWRHLFPLASLVTPNLAEAGRLAGMEIAPSREAMETVARRLRSRAATAWLVKGGHGDGAVADDLLLQDEIVWLSSPRIDTKNTHGTGCTLSSAIAANLAKGATIKDAVIGAKAYIDAALAGADRLSVGHGSGPVDHFVRWR
jgi:hydroxymethylpyrimidine/phosphomethylpyrimidine kinase